MKRIVKLVLSFLFILMVVGCSQNSLTGKEEVLEGGSFVSLDSNVDINTARDIALARIDLIQSTDEGSPQFPVSITNDWNNIYTELANNRPAILHYQETDGGHTAAIYSAKLYRDQWTGVVASVESSVVTGWGDVDTTSSRNRPPRKTVNTTSFVLNEVVTVKIY